MTKYDKIVSIYNDSTDYYEFLIKLGLNGYEIDDSFKINYIIKILTTGPYGCFNDIPFYDIPSFEKALKFISEYINDEEFEVSHIGAHDIAVCICSWILTSSDKSIIMPCFRLLCQKIPDIMKKEYEEQKQFLKYKIN